MASSLPSPAVPASEFGSAVPVSPNKRLHEGHRTCLERVARGMSTKEIARETGLAPSSVDTYLKQAISILGTTNRRHAARLYLESVASQKSGSPPAALPPVVESAPTLDPARGGSWSWRDLLRLPPVGGVENESGWREKTLHILQVALVAAASVLALTLTIAGFYRILR